MRLPHPSTGCLGFLAQDAEELLKLVGEEATEDEAQLIRHYFQAGLPPVTSRASISAMFGFNEGFVWSLLNRTRRHYRRFEIPKGQTTRTIYAPKVGLKTVQKWLSVHFQNRWSTHESVYGFVPGRSHLAAAAQHVGSSWVASVDIENFFPSVSLGKVRTALEQLGYTDEFSKEAITTLTCLGIGLTQGAPTSPVISNIVLNKLDIALAAYASTNGYTYTRYADDIVMSGSSGSPDEAVEAIRSMITGDGWKVAEGKTTVDRLPGRLKVHGLLVHGDRIRLTKGYRNRLRAYRHLMANGKVRQEDVARIKGHLEFAASVDRFESDQ